MKYSSNSWRQFARSVLGAVLPKRLFLTKASHRTKAIFLTFDDGPHPEHTPRILDALAKTGTKGTFFVIGREAEKYPQLIRRIASEGHAVGDHTWTHSDVRTLSGSTFREELQRSACLLSELTGKQCRLFRPPYGKIGARQLLTLFSIGRTVVLWNTDPRDYSCKSTCEVQDALSSWQMQAGDVVLLHDNTAYTADAVTWIIRRQQCIASHVKFLPLHT